MEEAASHRDSGKREANEGNTLDKQTAKEMDDEEGPVVKKLTGMPTDMNQNAPFQRIPPAEERGIGIATTTGGNDGQRPRVPPSAEERGKEKAIATRNNDQPFIPPSAEERGKGKAIATTNNDQPLIPQNRITRRMRRRRGPRWNSQRPSTSHVQSDYNIEPSLSQVLHGSEGTPPTLAEVMWRPHSSTRPSSSHVHRDYNIQPSDVVLRGVSFNNSMPPTRPSTSHVQRDYNIEPSLSQVLHGPEGRPPTLAEVVWRPHSSTNLVRSSYNPIQGNYQAPGSSMYFNNPLNFNPPIQNNYQAPGSSMYFNNPLNFNPPIQGNYQAPGSSMYFNNPLDFNPPIQGNYHAPGSSMYFNNPLNFNPPIQGNYQAPGSSMYFNNPLNFNPPIQNNYQPPGSSMYFHNPLNFNPPIQGNYQPPGSSIQSNPRHIQNPNMPLSVADYEDTMHEFFYILD